MSNYVCKLITFDGKTQTMTAWAKELNITLPALSRRFTRSQTNDLAEILVPRKFMKYPSVNANGVKLSLAQLAKKTGISGTTLRRRIFKQNKSVDEASKKTIVIFNGKNYTKAELSRMYNIKNSTLHGRLKRGIDIKDALEIPIAKNQKSHKSVTVIYKGEERLLSEICKELNLVYPKIHARIFRLEWDVDRAIDTPIKPMKSRKPKESKD